MKAIYNINEKSKMIGSGAFGQVYLCNSKKKEDFYVAIKVLKKDKLMDHLDAIKEEINILTKLDHPNIVKYYETYIDVNYIYLVMEYIGGGELFDKLTEQENQTFTEEQARIYMKKLFGACAHMHHQGVCHRDIKPENIMLSSDGELKIIDFGLSKRHSPTQKLKTIAGTPHYMAPEIID